MKIRAREKIASILMIFFASGALAAASIDKLFLEGRYKEVVDEASRKIESRSGRTDEVYYLKGLSELKLNRFSDARDSFNKILSKYQQSKLTFDAYTGIGDAYFLEGNVNEALRVYNEILVKFPEDRNITVIRDRINDCRSKMGLTEKPKPAGNVEYEKTHQEISGNFSVQVGSFGSKNNAQKFEKKLRAKGYDSYIDLPVAEHDNLYRVKVGKLQSRQDAENLANRLKRDGYRTAICAND